MEEAAILCPSGVFHSLKAPISNFVTLLSITVVAQGYRVHSSGCNLAHLTGLNTEEPPWRSSPARFTRAVRARCGCSCGSDRRRTLAKDIRSSSAGPSPLWAEAKVAVAFLQSPKWKEPAANWRHEDILEKSAAAEASWCRNGREGLAAAATSAERPGVPALFSEPFLRPGWRIPFQRKVALGARAS